MLTNGYDANGAIKVQVREGGTWPGTTGTWRTWGRYNNQADADRGEAIAKKTWLTTRQISE